MSVNGEGESVFTKKKRNGNSESYPDFSPYLVVVLVGWIAAVVYVVVLQLENKVSVQVEIVAKAVNARCRGIRVVTSIDIVFQEGFEPLCHRNSYHHVPCIRFRFTCPCVGGCIIIA